MEINNSLAKTAGKPGTFSQFLGSEGVKKSLANSLGNPKSVEKFTSSILSAVSVNPGLQKCDFSTVVSAGLLANALNLSLSPSLGFAYIIPFEDRKNDRSVATFVLGYRGYIQLAVRSGYYERINVVEVREGELLKRDDLNEEYEIRQIEDDEVRENTPVVGYLATFKYISGFRKTIYWSKKKMISHADRYSKAFSAAATTGRYPKVSFADYEAGKYDKADEWKYSSYWYKDFDGMAKKTMLRQLISKWGIMSIDMQTAYDADIANETKYEDGVSDVSFTVQADVENDLFDGEETAPAAEPAKKRGRPAKKTDEPTEAEQTAPVVETIFPDAEDVFGDLN